MNKAELREAVKLAGERSGIDFGTTNINVFSGFGLKQFQPIHVTLADVADLIRYQAVRLDGELDATALNEIAEVGRNKFIIVG